MMIDVANYTEFRKNMSKYMDEVADGKKNLIITRGSGRKKLMVMTLDEFNDNKADETSYLMSNEENKKKLLQGIKDIKNKNYKNRDKELEKIEKELLCD